MADGRDVRADAHRPGRAGRRTGFPLLSATCSAWSRCYRGERLHPGPDARQPRCPGVRGGRRARRRFRRDRRISASGWSIPPTSTRRCGRSSARAARSSAAASSAPASRMCSAAIPTATRSRSGTSCRPPPIRRRRPRRAPQPWRRAGGKLTDGRQQLRPAVPVHHLGREPRARDRLRGRRRAAAPAARRAGHPALARPAPAGPVEVHDPAARAGRGRRSSPACSRA